MCDPLSRQCELVMPPGKQIQRVVPNFCSSVRVRAESRTTSREHFLVPENMVPENDSQPSNSRTCGKLQWFLKKGIHYLAPEKGVRRPPGCRQQGVLPGS